MTSIERQGEHTPPQGAGVAARRQDIQGLRAVAVLMVVVFHAGLPVPGGFVGVDVFFVISGFVITAMLDREWLATGRINFGRFYARRFKRLTPALALAVAVVMILSVVLLSPFGAQQAAAKTAIGAMLLAANFVIARTTGGYFDAPAETNPLLNTWSLSVEEQFYLAFPGLLALGWLLARQVRGFSWAPSALVGGVALASFCLAVVGSSGSGFRGSESLIGFYSPFSRAWEFALGSLLAFASTKHSVKSSKLASALGVVGIGLFAASLWLLNGGTPFPGIWTLLPAIGTLLLLAAGSQERNPVSRLLATRPLVKIGDWSYSIYLWHWPFIVFAELIWPGSASARAIGAALSFAPALASYRWVEQPARAMAPQSGSKFVGLVVVTTLLPIALAGMLGAAARGRWWLDWPLRSTSGEGDHVAMSRGCTDRPFDPSRCTWKVDNSTGGILLVGDSQAYAFADGVIDAAATLGKDTTVSSRSGCPVSILNSTGDKPYNCPSWQAEIIDYSLHNRPDVVVIANRSSGYTRPELGWQTMIDIDGNPATRANATELYRSGLNEVVRILRESGIGVLIIQSIPEPSSPRASPSILRRLFPAGSATTFDPSRTLADRVSATHAEASVASANPGTVLFDPAPALCPSGSCPLYTDGRDVYLDTLHLTREGSLILTPWLRKAILRAIEQR